jgi:DNA-binding transcriptional regulator LsrR (DeoR family)
LYGEIRGLAVDKGYCYASNGWLAGKYGVTKVTISNWISKLKACNYISITYNPHRRISVVYKEHLKESPREKK